MSFQADKADDIFARPFASEMFSFAIDNGNPLLSRLFFRPGGEMADAWDLKSFGGNSVRVRLPPRAPS